MENKHKLIFVIVLILIAMAACNLPGSELPGNNGQIQNPLETIVALTVEAVNQKETATAAANPGQPSQPPASAETPADNPTAVPPTEIPTEEESATATITLTPTTSPDDPKKNLGSPAWTSNFGATDEWKWNDYDDPGHKAVYKGEQLHFSVEDPATSIRWTYGALNIENYYFEVTAFTQDKCSGNNRYGVIFGTPSDKYDRGYLYEVRCDGSFRLGVYNGSTFSTLINWTSQGAIKTGPTQSNELGVWFKGKKIVLYINGVKVGEVSDDTYTGKGKLGLLIDSTDINDFTIVFDDAAYWVLP